MQLTIDMVSLDRLLDSKNRPDLRNFHRTSAWLQAVEFIDGIAVVTATAISQANKRKMAEILWKNTLSSATKTGFYSTWLGVLSQNAYPNYLAGGYATWGARFVHDTDPANGGNSVFAGTNTTSIP
jgi:hypothetical protein